MTELDSLVFVLFFSLEGGKTPKRLCFGNCRASVVQKDIIQKMERTDYHAKVRGLQEKAWLINTLRSQRDFLIQGIQAEQPCEKDNLC